MRAKRDINKRIGANIKAARIDARYTQEKLAELVGITPNHLGAVERGVSGVSFDTVEKLCRVFGVSADCLLFGNPETDDFTMELIRRVGSVPEEYKPQVRKLLSVFMETLEIKEK